MSDGYSPEWHLDRKLEARIRQAQRARVWTAAYCNALPMYINVQMQTHEEAAAQAAAHADAAVGEFDKAWRTE